MYSIESMILKNFLLTYRKRVPIKNIFQFKPSKKSKCAMSLGGSFMEFLREKLPFREKKENKMDKYWPNLTFERILEQADRSFEEDRYVEVYETLNKIQYSKNIEVIWRLARALFNLSFKPEVADDVKQRMIEEAYEILEKSKKPGRGQANYHKWMAIITNRKNGLESLEAKIKGYPKIRDHLIHACDNDPTDFTVHYMLGRWHYEMASLTWLQRKIAKYLFQEPPESTFVDAYRHLYKAEELNPRFFLPNIYLLGCVCMQLGQYYRAKYYLNMAVNLPPHTQCEDCCVTKAEYILEKLEKYDLGKDLLFENMQFVHGFEN